jgi:flagellar hook protein FlgE
MPIPSLFIGATALTTMQEGISVIANNIANVNTTAYKASRVHYFDQTYSDKKFGSSPTTTRGGLNPGQVGTGIKIADINTIHSQGALKSTGLASDLAMNGDGFFVVTDELTADLSTNSNNANTFNAHYTRNGHFLVDADQNMVTSDGAFVMGTMLYEPLSARIKSVDSYQNITYFTDQSVGPINTPDYVATDGIGANLPVPVPVSANTSGIGVAPVFDPTLLSELSVRGGVVDVASGITTGGALLNGDLLISRQSDGQMVFTFDDQNSGTPASTFSASFDTTQQILDGVLTIQLSNQGGDVIQLRIRLEPGVGSFDEVFQDINYDPVLGSDTMVFSGADPSTQDGSRMTVADVDLRYLSVSQIRDLVDKIKIPNFFHVQDPTLEVETIEYSIESDGTISIYGPSSENLNLGRLLVANFTNPDGLSAKGNSRYEESSNSGVAALNVIGGPFNSSAPSLRGTSVVSGALETSNVNLAEEFSEMIQQQRGLQAQSRTISTSDEILQTIINL